jgi:hypothetical protein
MCIMSPPAQKRRAPKKTPSGMERGKTNRRARRRVVLVNAFVLKTVL